MRRGRSVSAASSPFSPFLTHSHLFTPAFLSHLFTPVFLLHLFAPFPTCSPLRFGPDGSRTHRTDLARISRPQGTCQPVSNTVRGPPGNRTRSPALPKRCAAGTPEDLRLSSSCRWSSTCSHLFAPFHTSSHPAFQSDRGGNRTHKHVLLEHAAFPVCVPGRMVV